MKRANERQLSTNQEWTMFTIYGEWVKIIILRREKVLYWVKDYTGNGTKMLQVCCLL